MHLARIHGTEEDRVNCPFYFKIGACRHGDRCSRLHNKPTFSQTVLVPHMYQNPMSQLIAQPNAFQPDEKKIQSEFEEFYEEIFDELANYGFVEELHVCDNLGDHLVGNVYAKYKKEEDAAKCQKALHGRFYAGRPLTAEFSPVTDFREARCRQFDESMCGRGGYCNFMHIKHVSRSLKRSLIKNQKEPESSSSDSDTSDSDEGGDGDDDKKKSKKSRRRSRSRSRSRSRDRSRRSRRDEGDRKFKEDGAKEGNSTADSKEPAAAATEVVAPTEDAPAAAEAAAPTEDAPVAASDSAPVAAEVTDTPAEAEAEAATEEKVEATTA